MMKGRRSLLIGAAVLCAAVGAHAQESNTVIGPPQLKDFRLDGRRQVTPPPAAEPPAQAPPTAAEPRPEAPGREAPSRIASTPRQGPPANVPLARPDVAPADRIPLPPANRVPTAPGPVPAAPETAPAALAPAADAEGTPVWYYAVPVAMLALLGFVMARRRRRSGAEPIVEQAPAAAPPPVKPRPDPIPRPWLELSLKAERASFTATEAELLFELEIANKGGSDARNLRIDVKMFNGGAEQDKEIGTFFKTAGREATKLTLPDR